MCRLRVLPWKVIALKAFGKGKHFGGEDSHRAPFASLRGARSVRGGAEYFSTSVVLWVAWCRRHVGSWDSVCGGGQDCRGCVGGSHCLSFWLLQVLGSHPLSFSLPSLGMAHAPGADSQQSSSVWCLIYHPNLQSPISSLIKY